jgi:putative toxin-antitoxin system antitoxin component (TIGR02293 family)
MDNCPKRRILMQLAEMLHDRLTLENLDEAARGGVPKKFLDDLAQALGLRLRDLSVPLHVSERNLRRHAPDDLLSQEISDRALNIARVLERAVEVLDTQDRAARWLKHPNRALGATPMDMLGTIFGAERVLTVLDRIEHGVFS